MNAAVNHLTIILSILMIYQKVVIKKINEKIINKKIINEKKLTAKNSHVQFFSYIYSSTTKILIINE